jgi:hypothetical protein
MNNVKNVMSALKQIPKEMIAYSIFSIAGILFLGKRIFSRKKVNKKIYSKQKKRISQRLKLMFFTNFKGELNFISKKAESAESELNKSSNQLMKMKNFAEKLNSESVQSKVKEENFKAAPISKQDQIFYKLFENFSDMMIHTTKK